MSTLKKDLMEQLSASDAGLLKLLFAAYDNTNFLAFLRNKEAALHPLGNLTTDDWQQLTTLMQEFEKPNDARLLPYFNTFFSNYVTDKLGSEGILEEDYMATLYYDYAMKNDNAFLRSWFEFNLNVNNILAAIACRKHGFDPKKFVIGQNEVAQAIRTSNARDFGLHGMFDELEVVMRIAEEENLLEREKKIDALKWSWLEENTFFHYFSVEKVLAYVLKMEMIERWKMLSAEKGAKIFRDLLGSLKEGVKFGE